MGGYYGILWCNPPNGKLKSPELWNFSLVIVCSYFKLFNKPKPRGLGLKLSGKRTTNAGWGQSS